MPWDDTTLVVADLVRSPGEAGREEVISVDLGSRRVVAGGPGKGVSAMEPVWFSSGDGDDEFRLAYISDETGWWNVYAEAEGGGEKRERERESHFFLLFLSFPRLRERKKEPFSLVVCRFLLT